MTHLEKHHGPSPEDHQASVGDVSYVLGNHRLIEERGQYSPALEAQLKQHEDAGRTVTLPEIERIDIEGAKDSAAPTASAI